MKVETSLNHKPTMLITGASGLLGHTLCSYFEPDFRVIGLYKSHTINVPKIIQIQLDLTDTKVLKEIVSKVKPEIIVHTAGLTNVDQCESDPELAKLLNVKVTENVVNSSVLYKSKLIHISSDHLFDGKTPLTTEEMPVRPLNQYARTKAEAESVVARNLDDFLIIRTNFYGNGPPWRVSFSDWIRNNLQQCKTVELFQDVFISPIALKHLAQLLGALIKKQANGIFNVAGSDRLSKYDFGVRLAKKYDYSLDLITGISVDDKVLKAIRPKDMSLSCQKLTDFLGYAPPGVESGIATI